MTIRQRKARAADAPAKYRLGRRLLCVVLLAMATAGCVKVSGQSALTPPTEPPSGEHMPGRFVWHELLTDDPARARAFYSGLFGWTFTEVDEDGYVLARAGGSPIAGIVHHAPREAGEAESQWLSVLSVADVDAAVAAAVSAGGRLLVGPNDLPGRGRTAVVEDPQGAVVALLRAQGGDPPTSAVKPGQWLWNELLTTDPARAEAFYSAVGGYAGRDIAEASGDRYRVLVTDRVARAGVVQLPWPDVEPHWLPYIRVSDVDATMRKTGQLGGQVLLPPQAIGSDERIALIADPTGAVLAVQQTANTGGSK